MSENPFQTTYDEGYADGEEMAEQRIAELQAENKRLRGESARDYHDMRLFQRKFIASDHKRRELEAEVERLREQYNTLLEDVRGAYNSLKALENE